MQRKSIQSIRLVQPTINCDDLKHFLFFFGDGWVTNVGSMIDKMAERLKSGERDYCVCIGTNRIMLNCIE